MENLSLLQKAPQAAQQAPQQAEVRNDKPKKINLFGKKVLRKNLVFFVT